MTSISFGTDGWRGRIAKEVTFANVRRVAAAIASSVREDSAGLASPVVVGYDTRFLSKAFAKVVAEVLARQGIPVLLSQRFAPTPALSYAVVERNAAAGVIVTGSHNPPSYTGVKLKSRRGSSAPPEMTTAIEARLRGPDHRLKPPASRSTILAFDPKPAYVERLAELVDLERVRDSGVEVVLDPMYGATQGWLSTFLREWGIQVQELHARVDSCFGGVPPEPLPRHLSELAAVLSAPGASRLRVGFAFDGDGDRLAAIDEAGTFMTPHHVFALVLKHLVEHRGLGGAVVKNFATTTMVEKLAKCYGLPCYETPIGFKYVAERMEHEDVLIGGEESGGIGVKGHIPERDGMLAALLLLELMAVEGKPLGRLLHALEEKLGPHCYGRLDLPLLGEPVDLQLVRQRMEESAPAPLQEVRDLDGLKFLFQDGSWLLLRPSGTEPVLRVYAEAPSPEEVEQLLDWGRAIVGQGSEGRGHDGTQHESAGWFLHGGTTLGSVDDPRRRGGV